MIFLRTNRGTDYRFDEDETPLRKTLEIRQNPLAFKDREDIRLWLKSLGPIVQQYADVLEHELQSIAMKKTELDRGKLLN